MKDFLYRFVDGIAQVHDAILNINDSSEAALTDKQLHFIIIGMLGLIIYLGVHEVFKRLAGKSIPAISWIYAFTVVLFITFAIEIGQHVTGTGNMELMDIIHGLAGVLVIGIAYTLLARLYRRVNRQRTQGVMGKKPKSHG